MEQKTPSELPTSIDNALLEDDFDSENNGNGAINYTTLTNWNVFDGTIDLLGHGLYDTYPGNGLYVDLDGSSFDAGRIESKEEFLVEPGTYLLEFSIAGYDAEDYQTGDTNTVTAQLGDLYEETFTMETATPFEDVTRSITISTLTTSKLIFDHSGGDFYGILLDNVKLSKDIKGQQSP